MDEWRAYQRLVLSKITEFSDDIKDLRKSVEALKEGHHDSKSEIKVIKSRSSFWGSIGGACTIAVYLFYEWITHKIKT